MTTHAPNTPTGAPALTVSLRRACRHFNGLLMGRCQAGVAYAQVADRTLSGLAAYPCFPEGAARPCPLRQMPSEERDTDGP